MNILDAKIIIEIFKKALLPDAKAILKGKDSVFPENNDAKYKICLCTNWIKENSIVVMDWPSRSSAANLIESVWKYIYLKLHQEKKMQIL